MIMATDIAIQVTVRGPWNTNFAMEPYLISKLTAIYILDSYGVYDGVGAGLIL